MQALVVLEPGVLEIQEKPVPEPMQALVVLDPGVREIQEKPVPEPGPGEVLARVRSTAICGTDAHLIHGDYPGFWPPAFPFTPGHEWAGELVALRPGGGRGPARPGPGHGATGRGVGRPRRRPQPQRLRRLPEVRRGPVQPL